MSCCYFPPYLVNYNSLCDPAGMIGMWKECGREALSLIKRVCKQWSCLTWRAATICFLCREGQAWVSDVLCLSNAAKNTEYKLIRHALTVSSQGSAVVRWQRWPRDGADGPLDDDGVVAGVGLSWTIWYLATGILGVCHQLTTCRDVRVTWTPGKIKNKT